MSGDLSPRCKIRHYTASLAPRLSFPLPVHHRPNQFCTQIGTRVRIQNFSHTVRSPLRSSLNLKNAPGSLPLQFLCSDPVLLVRIMTLYLQVLQCRHQKVQGVC